MKLDLGQIEAWLNQVAKWFNDQEESMADQIEIFALPESGFMPMRQGDPVRLRADSCLSIRRPGMDCGLCRAGLSGGGAGRRAVVSDA